VLSAKRKKNRMRIRKGFSFPLTTKKKTVEEESGHDFGMAGGTTQVGVRGFTKRETSFPAWLSRRPFAVMRPKR